MTGQLDYWKFIAGLGLFLYGMARLEDALKELAGRRFKLFLKKYTKNRLSAIFNGALATAILQSSSIVLLMVIAFTGAGIITLSNSLGIILGANLGTTMTGWIVSLIGFNTKLESYIFPIVGIGSLGSIFFINRYYLYHIFRLIVAMGLLLMGLDFMKNSMGQLATLIDLGELEKLGLWAFFLFGFFVTAVIQSSSAMMTITLSALHVNIISLVPAAFIIIGADLGTTITALIASFNGTAVKKRVGLAHFFFNISTAILAFTLVTPIIYLVQIKFHVTDTLYALVAFHSIFNALGIILFFPFLGIFERFLNRFFQKSNNSTCKFIQKVSTEVPEASLEAIRLELNHFAKRVFNFNLNLLGFTLDETKVEKNQDFSFLKSLLSEGDSLRDYEEIKKTEEELLEYFTAIQRERLEASESEALNRYILALRSGVQSAKSSKDIQHNIKEFHESVIEIVESMMKEIMRQYLPAQKKIPNLWNMPAGQSRDEEFIHIRKTNETAFRRVNEWIYQAPLTTGEKGLQIATFLNVNREIYNANQLLIESLKGILFPAKMSSNLFQTQKSN